MSMLQTYENITKSDENGNWAIRGRQFLLREDAKNEYKSEKLPIIPAGSVLVADFAGDFGMYGLTEINGVLHHIKIPLDELHKIDFGDFDARNKKTVRAKG